MNKKQDDPWIVRAPQDYALNPIFPADGSRETRKLLLKNGTEYLVGGNLEQVKEFNAANININHLHLLLAILYLYQQQSNGDEDTLVYFTLYDLCTLTGRPNSGQSFATIRQLLYDLRHTPFKRISEGKGKGYIYHIIRDYNLYADNDIPAPPKDKKLLSDKVQNEFDFVHTIDRKRMSYLWLESKFLPILTDTIGINLSELNKIQSRIGKVIYTYIVPRASQASADKKWSIGLKLLFERIGLDIEKTYKFKAVRKKALTQNKHKIMDSLDGRYTANQRILKVDLELTKDKKDFKLVAWTIDDKVSNERSAGILESFWVSIGGDVRVYKKAVNNPCEIPIHFSTFIQRVAPRELEIDYRIQFWSILYSLFFHSNHVREYETCISEIKHKYLENPSLISDPLAYTTQALKNLLEKLFDNSEK